MKGWMIVKDYGYENDPAFYSRLELRNRHGYGQVSAEQVQDDHNQIFARQINVRPDLKLTDIENQVRFRLLNDDHEVDYEGVVSLEWLESNDELAYHALNFGEADVGSTMMDVLAEDLPQEWADREHEHNCVSDEGWVNIY